MSSRSERGRHLAFLAAAVFCLSACGSRVSGAEIIAGAGGGTVKLDPGSVAELQSLTSGAAPAAAAPTVDASAIAPAGVHAPATGGTQQTPASTKAAAIGTTNGDKHSVAAAVPGPRSSAAPAAVTCSRPGEPLKLGQIGAFSGLAGPITANARTTLAAWVQDVNARGGVACHPVVLYALDDGADPARAAAEVQQLQDKGVQALVGVFDSLGFSGVRSGAEKAHLPVIGGDGIDFGWNESPYLFPVGAGLLGTIRGALRQTVASGKTNLGLLYCVEASACTNGAKVIPDEAARAGGKMTYQSAVSLTQTDFTAQCQGAKNAGVQALGVAMDGASIARVARSCAAINFHPQFVTNGSVLSPQNGMDRDVRRNTLSSSSAVAPWMLDDTPGQRAYHAALRAYAPGLIPDSNSISAWASGALLEAVVNGLGAEVVNRSITTADLMQGLGKIHKNTLGGLTPPISFSPGQAKAPLLNCVYFELLSDNGWTATTSTPQCS